MYNFNPYLSSPNQGRNQTYSEPSRNYGYGGYQGPQYTPANQSFDGPDAWMQPNYPTQPPAGFNPYLPSPNQPRGMTQQEICQYTRLMGGIGGAAAGAWAGLRLGAQHCPNNQYKPACMAAASAGGAYAGATGADIGALNGSSCQSIVHQDAQGNTHYGSNFH